MYSVSSSGSMIGFSAAKAGIEIEFIVRQMLNINAIPDFLISTVPPILFYILRAGSNLQRFLSFGYCNDCILFHQECQPEFENGENCLGTAYSGGPVRDRRCASLIAPLPRCQSYHIPASRDSLRSGRLSACRLSDCQQMCYQYRQFLHLSAG